MNNSIARVGFWSALVAFAAASGYSISQILQVAGVVRYPLDGILIYGFSLLIATPFMLALLALHYMMPEEKRFWSLPGFLSHSAVSSFSMGNHCTMIDALVSTLS